jgi:hypothetical protein
MVNGCFVTALMIVPAGYRLIRSKGHQHAHAHASGPSDLATISNAATAA